MRQPHRDWWESENAERGKDSVGGAEGWASVCVWLHCCALGQILLFGKRTLESTVTFYRLGSAKSYFIRANYFARYSL
jgi:hypothetical protein